MKCSRAQRLISDYIDGSLSEKKSFLLKRHVHNCIHCQKVLEEFQKIVKGAGELEAPIPSENIWFKIKARLNEQQQQATDKVFHEKAAFGFLYHQPKLRFALSIIIIVILVSAVFSGLYYLRGRELGEKEDLQRLALKHLAEAELHYQLAIDALNKAISEENPNVNAQLVADLQKNLDILDASIRTCRVAVQESPDNLETRTYLLTMYKKKIALLNEIMKIKTETL